MRMKKEEVVGEVGKWYWWNRKLFEERGVIVRTCCE